MNAYAIPGIRWHFNNLPDDKKEELIRLAVNQYYGFECVLKKYKQNVSLSLPENIGRSVYVLFMKKYTKFSNGKIAMFYGGDHSSVYYHLNKLGAPVQKDRQKVIDEIQQIIYTV